MIDYIIFGEFDINEGNVIKLEYPDKTGVSDLILSSYMIPEGAHNTMTDTFTFILNKKSNSDQILLKTLNEINEKLNLNRIKYLDLKSSINFYQINDKIFHLKEIYNFNNFSKQWEPIKIENFSKDNNTFLKVEKDIKDNFHNFIIYNTSSNEVYYSIPIHSDIQFKKLKANFASIYTLNSQAIGFFFENDQHLDLVEKLFESDNELITNRKDDSNFQLINNIQSVLNNEKEIYLLCNFVTKLDKSSKRGAILKSIAIGTTKLFNLLIFKTLSKYLIEEIFKIYSLNSSNDEKFDQVKKLIAVSYKNFNALQLQTTINSSIRGILSYLQFNNYIYLNQDQKTVDLNIRNQLLKVDIAIADNPEKIFQSNLVEFCNTFKENTMIIYDAILSDKKIMFIGDSTTQCEKLSRFIFSCMSMVSPPCVGMLKRIYPYGNLYDLSFLERENAIYGVTNPIFKSKTDWWDVMCEIDTGKVVLSEKYKKQFNSISKDSDNFFIKELIYKIKNDYLTEFEVSLYFRIYTTHILNITGEEYFADDQVLMNEINKQWERKIKVQNSMLWKIEEELVKIKENISINGRSLKLIYNHINNIYKRKFIEKEELVLIYSDIDKFLGNESLINELIYILCTFTIDFQIFFNAFFSRHPEIIKIIRNIYNKIGESHYGAQLFKKLNLVFLLKLNYLEIANEVSSIKD